MTRNLSEKWIKASIAGTIWAASEIVLGSFLHNLKVPFSGNVLTAIGLIILISISYMWVEKGLFWRAGLICALLKTMSPSAVIFGPMIAIFVEGLLLETFVRLLGRTFAGYLLGAMAAMSWNLVQKILNYIIFYGSNIIDVYTNLLKMAQKQFDIQTDIVWLPVIIFLIIYALFGLFAGVIGIRVGSKMQRQPESDVFAVQSQTEGKMPLPGERSFNYSIGWLLIDVALIIISFILLSNTSWMVWSPAITVIIIMWAFRYKRALRQLSKPRFWIFFVLITLLTAFVFTRARSGENVLKLGLLTGFQMNFRAVIIIVGFAVLGTELYNPVVRNFFLRTSFKNLPIAIELSVESLPAFISNIPDFRSLVKNPVSVFYHVISRADKRLAEIKGKTLLSQKIFIVTGAVGEGKTTFLKKLILLLAERNIKACGILSERVMTGMQTTGYDIVNVETGDKVIFLRQDEELGPEKIGRFYISPEGLAAGNAILNSVSPDNCRIVIIDEVGLLELQGKGWASAIGESVEKSGCHILITVRDSLAEDVKKKWNLTNAVTIKVGDIRYPDTSELIIEQIGYKP